LRIEIYVVGKLKDFAKIGAQEYIKILSKYADVKVLELKHTKISDEDQSTVKQDSQRLFSRLKESDYVILLDEKGEECDSFAFARTLESLILQNSKVIFVVGGPFGVDNSVKERADRLLSLSKLTMTHQLATVVLLEQLFRAFKIIHGERYHY